jgi:hypothetical protein
VGLAPLVAGEPHGPNRRGDALTHLLAFYAEVLESERHVVFDERGYEAVVRVLEENPYLPSHQIRFGGRVEPRHAHPPGVWPEQAVQEARQGRLSAAVWPHDPDVLPGTKLEGHVRERLTV